MTNEQSIQLETWKYYIDENIKEEKSQMSLYGYVERLINSDTIVILDFEHLAKLIGIEYGIFTSIINSPSSFYYNFELPP